MLQANEDRKVLEEFVMRDGRTSVKLQNDEGQSLADGGNGDLELKSALEATLGNHQFDATSRFLQETTSGSYHVKHNRYNSSTIVNFENSAHVANLEKLNVTTSDTNFDSGLSPKMTRPRRRAARHSKPRATTNSDSRENLIIES